MNQPLPAIDPGATSRSAPPPDRPDLRTRLLYRLKQKPFGYWIAAAIVLTVATVSSPYVYDYLNLTDVRSRFFQRVLEWGPRPAEPRVVKLVMIGDDEYWEGPLAGRRPVKRDYLADMIDTLVAMNVHVIGIDFDVRLPNPNSPTIPDDYRLETKLLIDAIKNAARHGKKIVLATPVEFAGFNIYRQDGDIYQTEGLCLNHRRERGDAAVQVDLVTLNISCGYIALPDDPLRI